jgi:CRISPR-associated protein Cas2
MNRFTYIIIFFDIPTINKSDRAMANKFRIGLLKLGFFRIQLSVYSKICKGDNVESSISNIKKILPSSGNVRILKTTYKQYKNMEILVGKANKTEEMSAKKLIII